MPKPGKGTDFVKFILSKSSKDMREPLLPMVMVAMETYVKQVRVKYCNRVYYELCGQIGHLIASSGAGKGELTRLVKAVTNPLEKQDIQSQQRWSRWQEQVKTMGSNQKKPQEPLLVRRCPPADTSYAAFVKNAIALEQQGELTQYFNISEVDRADRLCGGHEEVSQMIRLIYDCERGGTLRATADGVTGNPVLRANLTFSSPPEVAREFYGKSLTDGFFGRVAFAYKPRGERSGKIPQLGEYDEDFYRKLDDWIGRLSEAKGDYQIRELNKVAEQLAEEQAQCADECDDDIIFELSHRSILSAWKKGAVLWLLNGQVWTRSIGEFVRWFCYYDLWSKCQVFGDRLRKASRDINTSSPRKGGPVNMLQSLPDTFSLQQLENLRIELGKSTDGTGHQLRVWKNRGFITGPDNNGIYSKVHPSSNTPRP